MIPKNIYYVWVGGNKKPDIFYKCLDSWQENLPGYTITEVNETNFDMKYHLKNNKFFRECYKRKIWAFVSDYMRVVHLYENGGIYLDIDMQIIKDFSELLDEGTEFFAGFEDEFHISAGVIGSCQHSSIMLNIINFYNQDIWSSPVYTIPNIMTQTVAKTVQLEKPFRTPYLSEKIKLYPSEYFYPYHFTEEYSKDCLTDHTYGIHWWNNSWQGLKNHVFLRTKHMKQPIKGAYKLALYTKYILRKNS